MSAIDCSEANDFISILQRVNAQPVHGYILHNPKTQKYKLGLTKKESADGFKCLNLRDITNLALANKDTILGSPVYTQKAHEALGYFVDRKAHHLNLKYRIVRGFGQLLERIKSLWNRQGWTTVYDLTKNASLLFPLPLQSAPSTLEKSNSSPLRREAPVQVKEESKDGEEKKVPGLELVKDSTSEDADSEASQVREAHRPAGLRQTKTPSPRSRTPAIDPDSKEATSSSSESLDEPPPQVALHKVTESSSEDADAEASEGQKSDSSSVVVIPVLHPVVPYGPMDGTESEHEILASKAERKIIVGRAEKSTDIALPVSPVVSEAEEVKVEDKPELIRLSYSRSSEDFKDPISQSPRPVEEFKAEAPLPKPEKILRRTDSDVPRQKMSQIYGHLILEEMNPAPPEKPTSSSERQRPPLNRTVSEPAYRSYINPPEVTSGPKQGLKYEGPRSAKFGDSLKHIDAHFKFSAISSEESEKKAKEIIVGADFKDEKSAKQIAEFLRLCKTDDATNAFIGELTKSPSKANPKIFFDCFESFEFPESNHSVWNRNTVFQMLNLYLKYGVNSKCLPSEPSPLLPCSHPRVMGALKYLMTDNEYKGQIQTATHLILDGIISDGTYTLQSFIDLIGMYLVTEGLENSRSGKKECKIIDVLFNNANERSTFIDQLISSQNRDEKNILLYLFFWLIEAEAKNQLGEGANNQYIFVPFDEIHSEKAVNHPLNRWIEDYLKRIKGLSNEESMALLKCQTLQEFKVKVSYYLVEASVASNNERKGSPFELKLNHPRIIRAYENLLEYPEELSVKENVETLTKALYSIVGIDLVQCMLEIFIPLDEQRKLRPAQQKLIEFYSGILRSSYRAFTDWKKKIPTSTPWGLSIKTFLNKRNLWGKM